MDGVKDIIDKYFEGDMDNVKLTEVKKLLEDKIITKGVYVEIKKLKHEHSKSKSNASKYKIIYPLDEPVIEDFEELHEKELEKMCKGENVKNLDEKLERKKNEIKTLKKKLMFCKSRGFKYGRETGMRMRDLLDIIRKENKGNVKEFLDLFPTTSERVKGMNVTRNHVYEALWIIVYLKELDNPSKKRQFYKSVEGGGLQSKEDVLNGNVNSGNEGGIADLYFEMIGEDEEIEAGVKLTCNRKDILIPHCENKTIKAYDKYLFSSKYYRKTKGVSNYDIQDIFTEAIQRGLKEFNIVLLVQNKHELLKKMDTSNKSLSNLCHAIYGIDDLDVYYKQLLYQLKNKTELLEEVKKYIQPRFHQQYFIDYTKHCMDKFKSKKFVWGAVPRSGKSYMIAGFVAKESPKYVFLILGAITETKDQFIKMFRENKGDFDKYNIHDLQRSHGAPQHNISEGKHIFVCSQEAIRMHHKKETVNIGILNIFKSEKDKLIFFDEIHQGSGEGSLQEDFLTELVFENDYKAFVMVTATFAKPFLKYMNKGGEDTKLIQWRYDDIHLMKSIDKKIIDEETGEEKLVTYDKIKDNILEEEDGEIKLNIFDKLLSSYEKDLGIDLERLAKQYKIYPELIVSTPIISDMTEFSDIIVEGNIAIDKIFKPLMTKKLSDENTARIFIKYIEKGIYENYILQTLNKGSVLRKPHSEIWFLPTMFRGKKGDDEEIQEGNKKGKKSPFGYMTKNFATLLMQNEWFKEHYCIIILHSVGFENIEIDFIQAKEKGGNSIKWNDAKVSETGESACISTICSTSELGVKECILEQEACAKAFGKSVIILTGKMLRLGVSLPCVDIALHMDPIRSVDTIYQSMFRVLTEREGKTEGIFVDMLTTRQISFMYEYMNYVSKTEKVFSGQKKMKKLLEKLLLFNFNGINFQKGQEYQDLYNKLMKEFSLDDMNKFNRNIRRIDVSEVNEMLQNFDERFIEEFQSILGGLNISYKVSRRPKTVKKNLAEREGKNLPDEYIEIEPMKNKNPVAVQKSPELKEKYNEVSRFVKDMIMLFSFFSSETYYDIHDTPEVRKQIKKDIHDFFQRDIKNIEEICKTIELEDNSVIDCHLLNIIRSSVKESELQIAYNTLKGKLGDLFSEITGDDNFFNIYYGNIEQMKGIKNSTQGLKKIEACSGNFIKNEKVLGEIRKRLTVREEEKNLYGEVFTPIELICEMFSHIDKKVWENPDLKWLDPANGIGNFPVVAYYKLMESLKDKYDPKKYPGEKLTLSQHIINRMLYMVELNPVNGRVCKKIFKMIDPDATPHIHTGSFIKGSRNEFDPKMKFHVIMGNPPYNKGGIKAKNTAKNQRDQKDSETIWPQFVQKSLSLLEDDYYLLFINPGTWIGLKERGSNHKMFMENQLLTLRFYNYAKALELFGSISGKIPLTYYLLQKSKTQKNTEIYDNCLNKYIPFNIYKNKYIPIEAIKLQSKLKEISQKVGSLYEPVKKYQVGKNTGKDTKDKPTTEYKYPVVNISRGDILISYSKTNNNNKSEKKLVLPNDSMGYPLLDDKGDLYPINGHDHIVYSNDNLKELKQLQSYFYTSLVFYLINITKLSQNFFEYKVFHVLPDITKMTKKEDINDEDLIKLFNLDKDDIECIEKYKQNGEGRLSTSQIKYFKEWRIGSKSSKPSKDIYGDDPKYEGQVGAPEGFEPEPELEPPEVEGDKPKRTSSKGKSKRSKKKTGKKKKKKKKMRRTFRKKKNNRTMRKIRL